MKTFYCIIKGRWNNPQDEYSDGWWTQIIKDTIQAEDKKEARKIVTETYGKNIPMRMKASDIKEDSLLLSLYEIDGDSYFKKGYFDDKECTICGSSFSMISKYNLFGSYGSDEQCSPKCTEKYNNENFVFTDAENFYYSEPVIYMITQISTGKKYIGKTERSFTLRWWEHIKSKGSDKFHTAMNESSIEDFIFQVLEHLKPDRVEEILKIEQSWIRKHNSIEDGFNTMGEAAKKIDESKQKQWDI